MKAALRKKIRFADLRIFFTVSGMAITGYSAKRSSAALNYIGIYHPRTAIGQFVSAPMLSPAASPDEPQVFQCGSAFQFFPLGAPLNIHHQSFMRLPKAAIVMIIPVPPEAYDVYASCLPEEAAAIARAELTEMRAEQKQQAEEAERKARIAEAIEDLRSSPAPSPAAVRPN